MLPSLHLALPLVIGIVVLLAILTFSYEQTIHAYPGGGGAYIVARDNLGELPAQTAGAALLTDYILTVAVSISSGVAQLISAYPGFIPISGRNCSGYDCPYHGESICVESKNRVSLLPFPPTSSWS